MKKNGPWTIKSSEVKYKNPWIEVREDQVIRPDGKDGIYGVVNNKNGVSILALDNEGFVYVTEEFKYASEKTSIEVVSGAIDGGELPLEAAKRELAEEAGLEADEWIDLGRTDPFTSVIRSWAQLYLARTLRNCKSNLEGTETLQLRRVAFDEAVRMVEASEITHGPSCVVILKAKLFLDK